jgi:hypothetical protein
MMTLRQEECKSYNVLLFCKNGIDHFMYLGDVAGGWDDVTVRDGSVCIALSR